MVPKVGPCCVVEQNKETVCRAKNEERVANSAKEVMTRIDAKGFTDTKKSPEEREGGAQGRANIRPGDTSRRFEFETVRFGASCHSDPTLLVSVRQS